MKVRDLLSSAAIVVAAFASVGALRAAMSTTPGARADLVRAESAPLLTAPGPARPTSAPTLAAPAYAPLTGLQLVVPASRPIAVMVDNSADAVPQTGLDRADVVIEALVEGGITRFLAIFQSREATVEPVRSARTPFLHWVLEYDALYAHVGRAETPGPADAGEQIALWRIADLDYEGGPNPASAAFTRDPSRPAPHNVRTTTGSLRAAAQARDSRARESPIPPWLFTLAQGGDARGQAATRFTVRFGARSTFVVAWQWDAAAATYRRSQSGRPHLDAASGQQLVAANVIVIEAAARVADASGHVLIDLVGEGKAHVFTAGRAIEATWRKPSSTARTRFYAENGAEVVLTAGATWIEVIDPSGSVQQ